MGTLGKIAEGIKKEWQKHKITDSLKKSNIGLISGLYYCCIYRTKESLDVFNRLLHEFNNKNEFLPFCSNTKYISFVCYKKEKEFLKRYLSKYIKYESDKVAGISINSPENVYTDWIVGFDSYILSFFREYNIGLNDYFPSGSEIILVLEEKSAYKMISILKEIVE